MKLHLDSSACVACLRLPTGQIPAIFEQWESNDLAVSSIVAAELEVGIHKSTRPDFQRARLDLFLARIGIDPFESLAARHYGEIRADLEKKGTLIGPLDLLIAAHARSLDATLITANVKEFRRVKGLKIFAWKG